MTVVDLVSGSPARSECIGVHDNRRDGIENRKKRIHPKKPEDLDLT